MHAIITHDLTVSVTNGKKSVNIIEDINLEVEEGETVIITGPSGAGKTTLLFTIGGLLKPTKGKVLVYKVDLTTLSEEALALFRNETIGFVFQDYNLISTFTALENVIFPMELLERNVSGTPVERAKNLLELVGLKDKDNLFPYQLSGGEKQRVAFARAMANNPDILLVDEPTGNLDEKSAERIYEILKTLKESGKTLIIVTHDRKLWTLGDVKYTMRDGRLF